MEGYQLSRESLKYQFLHQDKFIEIYDPLKHTARNIFNLVLTAIVTCVLIH